MNQELNPSNVLLMRVVGGATLFFGFLQMAIAAAAYNNEPPTGCWWVGLFCMFTGIFGLISLNKAIVMTGCILSVIALILAVVGMILDGVWSGEFNSLATCYNPASGGHYYGNTDNAYRGYALACENQNYNSKYDCYCVMNNVDANNDGDYTCYRFPLYNGNTCDYLMEDLPRLLTASWVFILLLFFMLLTYSVFTCIEGCECCKQNRPAQYVDNNNQQIQYQGQAQAQPTVVVAAAPIPGQAVAVTIAPQAHAVQQPYAQAYPNQQGGYGASYAAQQQHQAAGSINKSNYV